MLDEPHILCIFPNSIINSIKHEHSCKILFILLIIEQQMNLSILNIKQYKSWMTVNSWTTENKHASR